MSPHLFRAAVVVAVALTMLLAPRAGAQPRKEPLADRVQRSIQHAVENLFSKQRSDGDWEHDVALVQSHKGGASSLVVLALLNAGVPKDHPKLVAGLNYLRKLDSEKVYVKSLQTMALAEANLAEDRERLSKNVRWLLDARAVRGGKLEGWGYGNTNPITTKNASTTQYAVLALWAAKQAGIDVPREA